MLKSDFVSKFERSLHQSRANPANPRGEPYMRAQNAVGLLERKININNERSQQFTMPSWVSSSHLSSLQAYASFLCPAPRPRPSEHRSVEPHLEQNLALAVRTQSTVIAGFGRILRALRWNLRRRRHFVVVLRILLLRCC